MFRATHRRINYLCVYVAVFFFCLVLLCRKRDSTEYGMFFFFLVLLLVAIPYKTDTGENVVARPTQKNFGCVDVCVLVIVCSLYVFHGCKSVVRHQQRCNRNIQSNPFENIRFGRIDE